MAMKYELHVKSQKSKGASRGFGGPDTYVAVTVRPDGVELPAYLNQKVLTARGIKIAYFGEGYRGHSGPHSALGKAIKAANEWIARETSKQGSERGDTNGKEPASNRLAS